MRTGIILLNFGEPEEPALEAVVPYLERIFAANMSLEGALSPEAAKARIRQLAEQRAPGLIEEYQAIGGSPLNRQAHAQARELAGELERRGHEVRTYVAYQFAEPLIKDVVREAERDGVELLIGLPVYPFCGPSTTVAALEMLRRAVAEMGWGVRVGEVAGWHLHPHFVSMWADRVRETVQKAGVELSDPAVALVFSVHGTPLKYIEEGSRYVEYAEASCAAVAAAVGVKEYRIGYQNHTNRPVAWTQPDVDRVIEEVEGREVVVVPIAFMHEQSETLAELDHELREAAEGRGLVFHRVPVPHDDARVAALLADLVEPLIAEGEAAGGELRDCSCRPGAVCRGGSAVNEAV